LLDRVAGAARQAVQAEEAGDESGAIELWKSVFGSKYPSA
jgi:hypothetical protein